MSIVGRSAGRLYDGILSGTTRVVRLTLPGRVASGTYFVRTVVDGAVLTTGPVRVVG